MNPILRKMCYGSAITQLEKVLAETHNSDEQRFLNRVLRELHTQKDNDAAN